MERKLEKKEIKTLIFSAILLVVGVLFCCSLAMGNKAVSWIIGLSLIVFGIFCIINAFTSKKDLMTVDGIIGAAIIAFGLLFAGNELTWVIFNYIPFLLMAIGVIFIADAIIKIIKDNGKTTVKYIIELIIGVIALALGLCLKFINGFSDFCSVILGVVLIIYSIYLFSTILLSKPEKKDN